MDNKLRLGPTQFEILGEQDSVLQFRSVSSALAFLRQFKGNPVAMSTLRGIVTPVCADVHRMSDEQVLASAAPLLAAGRYRLLRRGFQARSTGTELDDEQEADRAAKLARRRPPAPTEESSWIEVRLTDQGGMPVSGANYRITVPGGGVKEGILNEDGRARAGDLDPGTCEICFLDFDGKEWGATEEHNSKGQDYVVKHGDHLSSIAQNAGLANDDTVWLHPNNQALRSRLAGPHLLAPGDSLFVPAKRVMTAKRRTDLLHQFTLTLTALKIRLAVLDYANVPIANTPCRFEIEDDTPDAYPGLSPTDYKKLPELVTDSGGIIERPIPRAALRGLLTIGKMELPVAVSAIGPVETGDYGWQNRLESLGYDPGPGGWGDDAHTQERDSSVEEFKCDNGIEPVEPDCDIDSRDLIMSEHGC